MTNLFLNFPEGFTPNDTQTEILKKVDGALAKKKKFIIINAPTGAGKSFIPKTIANITNDTPEEFKQAVNDYTIFAEGFGPQIMENIESFGLYTLTITKALQDQYTQTFEGTGMLKGQGNYLCDLNQELSVDIAPCLYTQGLKQQCWKSNRCPYYNDRNSMLKSKFSVLNYSMFFSLPEHLRRRQLIVCDEGSELEDQIVNQFTCEIDLQFLGRLKVAVGAYPSGQTPPPGKIVSWLSSLKHSVFNKVEDMKDQITSASKSEISKLKHDYTTLTTLQRNLEVLIETYYDSQYQKEFVNGKIRYIPLKVDKLADYLFRHADTVIIMSATIIDHKNFAKTLGIVDYEYIETGSVFNPEHSPIYIMAKQKLNYQNLKTMLPTLAEQVKDFMDHHKGEKGIIHTHTQYIADYIRNNVNNPRLLCRELGVRNEDILKDHESSDEDTVLVSPSMTYGVDLKGDLAKFQIIIKAPWLPTKDIRVEKLMKLDKQWYANKMLCALVQASGRGTRSDTDECVTYILDGSIYDAIYQHKDRLPKFFLDRLQ